MFAGAIAMAIAVAGTWLFALSRPSPSPGTAHAGPQVRLSGNFTDPDGRPVWRARVEAWLYPSGGAPVGTSSALDVLDQTTTGWAGDYSLTIAGSPDLVRESMNGNGSVQVEISATGMDFQGRCIGGDRQVSIIGVFSPASKAALEFRSDLHSLRIKGHWTRRC